MVVLPCFRDEATGGRGEVLDCFEGPAIIPKRVGTSGRLLNEVRKVG